MKIGIALNLNGKVNRMREMYDLCRKYKYFYKKREDLEKFHRKYHDVDLSDAIDKTNVDLKFIEDDMMVELLKSMDVNCTDLKTENEFAEEACSFFRDRGVPICTGSTTQMTLRNSQRFAYVMSQYLLRFKHKL